MPTEITMDYATITTTGTYTGIDAITGTITQPLPTYDYIADMVNTDYKLVTQSDINDLIKRIYDVIADHTTIDISEEEFMKLVKDGK